LNVLDLAEIQISIFECLKQILPYSVCEEGQFLIVIPDNDDIVASQSKPHSVKLVFDFEKSGCFAVGILDIDGELVGGNIYFGFIKLSNTILIGAFGSIFAKRTPRFFLFRLVAGVDIIARAFCSLRGENNPLAGNDILPKLGNNILLFLASEVIFILARVNEKCKK
jgi:hypothetical protein